MGIVRAETIARMRGAFKEGLSGSRFIADMRSAGLSYRRSDMLADWRTIGQLETKKDLLKYVRKDYYPTAKVYATSTWNLSKEYMYVIKVKTQLRPDEPIVEHIVNIQRDVPLTPAMIEEQLIIERAKEEKYLGETMLEIVPFMAVRRI